MRVWWKLVATAVIMVLLMPARSAYAVAQGDGRFLYGEGTVTTPRHRLWTESTTTIGAESTGATAAATIRHVVIKASPIRDEMIAGIQTTGGTLYIQRWNGSAWSNEWNVTVANSSLPRFDIAYEAVSGEALVVYSGNVATTNELRYRTWNGSSWTGATNLDPIRTTGIVDYIKLARQPAANNLALAWGDSNFDLSANFWNGATNGFSGEPAAVLSTDLSKVGTATSLTNKSLDVTFESVSGDVMVAWGNDVVTDMLHVVRSAGAGGSWGLTSTNTSFFEEATDIELASEPGTDYIAYANATDNGADADAGIWTGSAWTPLVNFDTAIDTVAVGTKNISVTWLVKGANSRAVVTYDDNNGSGVGWLFYNKNTNAWSAVQTDFTTAPAPAALNDFVHQLRTNPYQPSNAMLTLIDGNSDLFAKRLSFDGTNLTWVSEEPGAAVLEATIGVANGIAADYAYSRFAPGTLSADIVDDNDASVASPSATLNSTAITFACQTRTGTLGVPTQKIRVRNGTANGLWTLSIAATAGSTANWSDGLTGYDFNDTSGAPAGCADGAGDADGLAGQLAVDPSVSTVAAMSDCATAGIIKGSSDAFSQGVINSITLLSSNASAQPSCNFDVTGFGLSQTIPAETPPSSYSLNLTLTVIAN